MLNLSDSESAELNRMLQTRSWGFIMKHLQDVAATDRKNILGGQITQDRLLEVRASQASLQRLKIVVGEVYQAAKMKPPQNFENLLG